MQKSLHINHSQQDQEAQENRQRLNGPTQINRKKSGPQTQSRDAARKSAAGDDAAARAAGQRGGAGPVEGGAQSGAPAPAAIRG
jgi:hypothetical protein